MKASSLEKVFEWEAFSEKEREREREREREMMVAVMNDPIKGQTIISAR
jgi:malic enzyme